LVFGGQALGLETIPMSIHISTILRGNPPILRYKVKPKSIIVKIIFAALGLNSFLNAKNVIFFLFLKSITTVIRERTIGSITNKYVGHLTEPNKMISMPMPTIIKPRRSQSLSLLIA
jgi:hypothetical protein